MGSFRRLVSATIVAAGSLLTAGGAPAPAEASTLFALVDTGEFHASADGGASWTIRSTLPVSDAAAVLAGVSASELFLASRTGTVYRSQDAGVNWIATGSVPASDVVDMVARTDGALLVLSTSGMLWVSTDAGTSFHVLASLSASDLVSVTRAADGTLLALTRTGAVRRSDDGGALWTVVGALTVSDAVAVRFAALDCFVITDTGTIYRSADQGTTWLAVGTTSQVGMRGLVADEGDLVAVAGTGMTARSSDGTGWSWVGTVNQVEVISAANDAPQVVGVPEGPRGLPRLAVAPPTPNPVRSKGALQLGLSLATAGEVALELCDVRGRVVASRSAERVEAGGTVVSWRLPHLSSGVYFLRVTTGGESATTRVVVLD